jgi:hypothetical protein
MCKFDPLLKNSPVIAFAALGAAVTWFVCLFDI